MATSAPLRYRGRRQPYRDHAAWRSAENVTLDREEGSAFGEKVPALAPDAVIDTICFASKSASHLVEAPRRRVRYFLHCDTIRVPGHSTVVPATEDLPRRPPRGR